MTHPAPLTLATLLLAGCYQPGKILDSVASLKDDIENPDSDADSDTDTDADSDTDTDADSDSDSPTPPEDYGMSAFSVSLDLLTDPQEVVWSVVATGDPDPLTIEMTLIQTGDSAFNCFVECNVWAEEHMGFSQVSDDLYELRLVVTGDPNDQDSGYSTLFDTEISQLSVLFTADNPTGQDPCLTGGDLPSYFYDVCP